MENVNEVRLTGNVANDPETGTTDDGQMKFEFSVVQVKSWTDKRTGAKRERRDVFDCRAQGKLAENLANNTLKGDRIVIRGRLQQERGEIDGKKYGRVYLLVDGARREDRGASTKLEFNNEVRLIANLTRDPDLRFLPATGEAVCDFSLAQTRTWKDAAGQEVKWADYIDCVAFGREAERLQSACMKGDRVMVRGRLQQDRWEDAESGEERSKMRVVVDGSKREARGGQAMEDASVDDAPPAERKFTSADFPDPKKAKA